MVHSPLSEAQTGLWFAQQLAPQNPSFNTGHVLWMQGPLDVAAFTQAANQAASEAQALQLQITDGPTGVLQTVEPANTPWLEVIDWRTQANARTLAQEAMAADMRTPLQLGTQPLARQVLFVLGAEHFAWYQRAHHLSTDGYGMALWESRVAALYTAAVSGQAGAAGSPLGALHAVLHEDALYRSSDKRAKDAAYWQDLFKTPPEVVSLNSNPAAKAISADYSLHLRQSLPESWRNRLLAFAQKHELPWPDVLTALTALYCQRFAGVQETVVGIPYMGRLGSASARVPAMVMNILPLHIQAQPAQSLLEFLQTQARQQTRARRHGRYRSEQLRRDLGLLGGSRRLYGPLINVQPFYSPIELPALTAQLDILGTGPVDDITIGFRGNATQVLELEIEANPNLYDRTAVEGHLSRIAHFIEAALQCQTLAEIPLATPQEAQHWIVQVNETQHPVPNTTLVALIEAQMRATPQAIAVEFEGQSLSYAQLDARSLALAQVLQQRGVGHDSLVAVALPRSLELVIALIAVQRAGGAYMPLDLHNPAERLAKIIELSQPYCALIQADDAHLLPQYLPKIHCHDWPAQPIAQGPLEGAPAPHHLAYVIYTSGSTGEPKGVMVEHQAIVNRLEWMRQFYGFSAQDRILQKTPATFDVSVWEFFLPLLCGCTLVVAPPEAHRDPAWLARIIGQQRITTCHFVPSMLAAFLAEPSARGLQMQRVFTSGEALGADIRDRFHACMHSQLHNLYGPTEAAVDVTYWPASAEDTSNPVPIGMPVWNTQLYVLNEQLQPLPAGVAGDLYLAGVQLARGYLGRPDLTRATFVANPFIEGERMYKTGDLARWRADGALEYIGRSDHQVKLRGLRIELGEIETVILQSAMASRCGVMVREDRAGDKKIVAYVQPTNTFHSEQLLQFIGKALPDYMVPSAVVALQDWPVTSNGKLDRKALPAPNFQAHSSGVPLSSPTEHRLAELFAQLLEQPAASLDAASNFFQLGGDSLSAVDLLLRIQQEWHRNPGLGSLFSHPSIAELAALIDQEEVTFDSGLAPVIQLASGHPSQAPLFVIHPAGGISWGYRHLAHALAAQTTAANAHEGPAVNAPALYGLQSPALDPSAPLPASIDALAKEYVQRVLTIQPRGPIHLLGWSVGGIIAQAMAVELEESGHEVGLVAMLDSYPSEVWRNEPEPSPIQALRALLAIAGYDPEQYPHLDTRGAIIAFLRQSNTALGNLPEAALDGVVRVVTDTNRLIRQHHHRPYKGTLTHVRAARDHADKPHLQSDLWRPYSASLETIALPFLHAQLTGKEASLALAPYLKW